MMFKKHSVLTGFICLCLMVIALAVHHVITLRIPLYVEEHSHSYYKLASDIALVIAVFFLARFYEKKRRSARIHALNEERLKLFIKHTPAAVAVLDNQMCYIEASDRWLQDYGIADIDIIGKCHYDIFPTIRQMPVWLDDHRRCLSGETIRREEDSFIGTSGKTEYLTYEMIPWHEENGKIGGLIFFTEVITPRVEAMQRLRESDARFERAVNGSNDGIWDVDYKTNEVYYSPRLKALLGYAPHEIGNKLEDWSRLLHPDDAAAVMAKIDDHLIRHVPYIIEYRLKTKWGDYKWIEARGQAEWDEEDKPVYFSGSLVDISEKKRLESLKTEFVYVVSHELRTPLSALSGALYLVSELLGKDMPARVEKLLDLALQGCNRLTVLVDDLLEAGRADAGAIVFDLQQVDVTKLLQQSVELNKAYGDRYGVTYAFENKETPQIILADPGRFMQVMANLLSNAAKFSPQYSVVTIKAEERDKALRISVQDKGCGISEEFKNRIFQKFARSGKGNVPGTGLGLNITKTMVERMGGAISFDSREGQGTTFMVDFPLVKP